MENWKARGRGAYRDWSEMDALALELVLLKLPEAAVVRASSVCARWLSVARSSGFIREYVKQESVPRGCLVQEMGPNCYIRERESGEYEIASLGTSYQVPNLMSMGRNKRCSEGAGGVFFGFTGPNHKTVHYRLNLVQSDWLVTSEMHFRMHDPIVGVVKTRGNTDPYKLVFAGGVADILSEEDDLAVEIYDSETDSWEIASPLPVAFKGCTSSLFLSPAVYGGNFYAYDVIDGFVSELNLTTKRWSAVRKILLPFPMRRSFLMTDSDGLSVVGIQEAGAGNLGFHVWKVDDRSMEISELKQRTTVPRPAPPFTLKGWFDLQLGSFLLIIAHLIVLCCGWLTYCVRKCAPVLSASKRLWTSVPSFRLSTRAGHFSSKLQTRSLVLRSD